MQELQGRGMGQDELNALFEQVKLTPEGLAQFTAQFGREETVRQMINDVAAARRRQ